MPSGAGLATLDVWDEKLANAGAELWAERLNLVKALRPLVEGAYQELASQPDPVEMAYVSSVIGTEELDPEPTALAQAMRERLRADQPREVERGVTLSGPHRDDLALTLRGLPARTHTSHGEAWSLALAFRLAAHRLLASDGEEPILLLDDVFAELDRRRRERLVDLAMAVEQSIVTASVPEEVPEQLKATMFHVEPGNVEREPGP
jgi:DNA replication and repair protein RecF